MQTQEEHGERVLLRFAEDGEEIGPAHKHQGSHVARHIHDIESGRHHATEDHHLHGERVVHRLEQPIKGKREHDQDDGAGQVCHDAETEEQLVGEDVVDGRGRVPSDVDFLGNV